MRLRLDYGTEGLAIDVPDDRTTVIEPKLQPAAANPHDTLIHALRSPIGKPPLRESTLAGKKIGISVCDITRAQPRRPMIEALLSEMPGVRPESVTIFIATG